MDLAAKFRLIEKLPKSLGDKLIQSAIYRYYKKYANVKITGYENIESLEGPIIFISNHLSNADGLVLNTILEKKKPIFVAGEKLSENSFTKMGIRVVETITIKPNSADKEAIAKIIKNLKEGRNIVIFPEGTRSRTGSMIEAKKGLLLIAKMSKATIVPIGLCGTENFMPINDNDMGKESFKKADIFINIGLPVEIVEKQKDEDKNSYSNRALKELMLSIAKLIPEKYRGVYSLEENNDEISNSQKSE
ncbi:lysophospholipid acyltransferase family protein [Clostridium sp. UBA6640]|uniref:lysophospholipid acyltransferase family protein n=1 Tax=Clostridium sp. UBA6640 TaxID=1946370 RepID=UPI0025BBCDCD|nr:lysophospholipid acyltransferase family protein [Clostridium sp. UBA6640]